MASPSTTPTRSSGNLLKAEQCQALAAGCLLLQAEPIDPFGLHNLQQLWLLAREAWKVCADRETSIEQWEV